MRLTKPEEESELLAALSRAYAQSPFWRDRFDSLGLSSADFVPGFPFEQLPLLGKADLLADQAGHKPLGHLLAVRPEDIRRIHKTSGTSASPFFIALTQRDIADTHTSAIRAFKAAGMGPGDRVVHCLNFNMWSGGVSDYLPIEMVGAAGVPFGVGNTALLLDTIRTLGINAISSTPSYMYALRDRCRSELGIAPSELGLKRGYFGGEGLLQVPGVREDIEREFGLKAMDANYGMSEVLSVIAGEDGRRDGLVYHAWGIVYAELVDGAGTPLPIEAGARGELVFSSLRREGQPLFRYRTNDLAEILWAETADDGLLRMRFRIIGRSDEMLVLRGVNFFPQALQSIIPAFEPAVGRAYRVVRPKEGEVGALDVLFETDLPPGPERDRLADAIKAKVSATFQVRIDVSWLPAGRISRETNKARYLIRDRDEI
ncbi:MAG: AMP-binding protein [Alphaproteobacteria bacterium]|nr:AMP-binding protein [Alphaproteobacteria bacterium]